ncbi:MAG: PIN domain-containing protein [Candidatus Njordarchaeota archaeon]
MRTKIVVDTSVIIEYIDRAGTWHRYAMIIFNEIIRGRVVAYIPIIVLSEVLYVAKRLYEKKGISDPKRKALRLVRWLYQHPNIRIVGKGFRTIVIAGLIKAKYHLAMSDCHVLAVSKLLRARPIFRKKEKEMLKYLDALKRRYRVVFLEDY